MTGDTPYRCLLSPRELLVLEAIAADTWNAVEWAGAARIAGLRFRCSALLIRGAAAEAYIGVRSVDLEPKLEAFRLTVSSTPFVTQRQSRARANPFVSSEEMMSAFVGSAHHILVGARRHSFDADEGERCLLTEDVLILRHHSGQQAFVCVDDDIPGSLVVVRDQRALSFPTARFAYYRAL